MGSWKNRPVRRGLTWCGDCRKWKAHKAFVRSQIRRGTDQWVQDGYIWKKYRTCNKCTRIYRMKPLSAADFLEAYGAEEHNDSEPEILIDEDETENIKNEDIKNEDVKDENVKAEGMITHTIKRIKINFKRVKTEDDNIKDGTVEVVRTKRVRFEEDEPEGVESKGGNEETSASKAL